ncbi:MAG TPA: cysteine--tRNA ligase [Candidatus Saccharimonadales bacterium]|nr:cysteine--tRNA ligase [Candidatus Saccharimonadales bacterium]
MKLYNTLTRKIEEIKPLKPPTVTVYTCGPTVYDYPHIGNWFTFIRYDLLIRGLKASGYDPKWVMNITDVGHLTSDADEGEDKLEKGAKREGKTAWEIAQFYTDYFLKGLERLNISKPAYLPKATDHIQEQIELIGKLERKGYTYVIDDGVYYDTSKFPKYADFAKLDLDDQQAGARVEQNPQKRNPTDFALWKFSPKDKKRDMEWDSPWGKGFPGWHLECSAMSMKYLGETLDIHSGGIDHIPVHHTNEIAQSEAATGKRFANCWMHTNHITVDDQKISKSLGNSVTLEDIEAKGYSLEAFRLHVLESHYRSQSKFSWDSLAAAQNRLKDFYAIAVLRYQASSRAASINAEMLSKVRAEIEAALSGDLNTPQILASLGAIVAVAKDGLQAQDRTVFEDFLKWLDEILGLNLLKQPDISDQQKQLIKEREVARAKNDWAKSDELRDQLAKQGIGLRDTGSSAIWHRL